jgi:hypothetical protein
MCNAEKHLLIMTLYEKAIILKFWYFEMYVYIAAFYNVNNETSTRLSQPAALSRTASITNAATNKIRQRTNIKWLATWVEKYSLG